jgi:hypothetical protein
LTVDRKKLPEAVFLTKVRISWKTLVAILKIKMPPDFTPAALNKISKA